MIALFTGFLRALDNQLAVIDVNGVGYEVMITARAASLVGPIGAPLTLQIVTQVREDAITLFGFTSRDEKAAFVRLTTVQGVGAKMAISLLSAFSPEQIWHAILGGDQKTLTQADGVGPKLAARLVTELKDFAGKQVFPHAAPKGGKNISTLSPTATAAPQGPLNEAVSALIHLGYSATDASRAVTIVANQNEGADLPTLIKLALREIAA